MKWISIDKAYQQQFCKHCNFAGRLLKQTKPCDYHRHGESFNYRSAPQEMCALRPLERKRIEITYPVRFKGEQSR